MRNMGLYQCPYILRSGAVCNEGCYRPEGCKLHWKAPPRKPCIECGKLTLSVYGACKKHSSKYRNMEYYNRKKLARIAEHERNHVNRDVLINQNKLGQCQLLMERPKGQEAS